MPTTKITVLNHQPVPLEPLSELRWSEGDVFYVGRAVLEEGSEYEADAEDIGWVVMDEYGGYGYPFHLADRYQITIFDHYDFEKTYARHLQPGETLVVEITG